MNYLFKCSNNRLSNNLFYFRIDNSGKEMLQEFYFLCTKKVFIKTILIKCVNF